MQILRLLFRSTAGIVFLFLFSQCGPEKDPGLTFNNDRERLVIEKYYQLAEEVQTLWPDYRLPLTKPVFLIFPDNAGSDTYGYLLNTGSWIPVGSERVNWEGPQVIYRNDDLVAEVKRLYGGVAPHFAFSFEVEGHAVFLSKSADTPTSPYIGYKMKDHNDAPLLVVHELFHEYQLFSDNPWQLAEWKQDVQKFPQTAEIIALSLLLFDVMLDAYHGNDGRAFLEKYVSIRRKQIELDPTPEQWVLHQATYTESVEGSARYLEHFGAGATIYPTIHDDPSHTFKAQLDTVSTRDLARHLLVQRVPYHVGAIVIKLLSDQGVDIHTALPAGKTPFSLAKQLTNKTNAQYDETLAQLKASVDWPKYQARAAALAALLK